MKLMLFLAPALLAASPAFAQDHQHHAPSAPVTKPDPHAGHDMNAAPATASEEVGNVPAPAAPEDHAADAIYDAATMARARQVLRREHGAFSGAMILFDRAEYQARKGGDGYAFEGEAWFGGDIDRLMIKADGEGTFGESIESAELQLLYSRAIAPYWNAHAGVRYDFRPDPSRTYAVIGIEGVAPYWFHLSGQVFVSDKGDVRISAEGSYDQRITQELILTPRAEFKFAAQDMPSIDIGAGLSEVELGLRLRYEIKREVAPYIGVEWARKVGATARYARASGEDSNVTNFVVGVRFWF